MISEALLTTAITLTLNLSDDPCTPTTPVRITFNQEQYEKYPGNQGGRIIQLVELNTDSHRYVLILEDDDVISFLQKEVTGYRSLPWLRGQLDGTLDALQSDNNIQVTRPVYCSLPSFNMAQYETL